MALFVLALLHVLCSDALSPPNHWCTMSCRSNGVRLCADGLTSYQNARSSYCDSFLGAHYKVYTESLPIPGTSSTIRPAKSQGPSRRAIFPAPRTSGRSLSCSQPQPEQAASSCHWAYESEPCSQVWNVVLVASKMPTMGFCSPSSGPVPDAALFFSLGKECSVISPRTRPLTSSLIEQLPGSWKGLALPSAAHTLPRTSKRPSGSLDTLC